MIRTRIIVLTGDYFKILVMAVSRQNALTASVCLCVHDNSLYRCNGCPHNDHCVGCRIWSQICDATRLLKKPVFKQSLVSYECVMFVLHRRFLKTMAVHSYVCIYIFWQCNAFQECHNAEQQ